MTDHEHTFEAGTCTQCGAIEAEVNKEKGDGDAPSSDTSTQGDQGTGTPAM